MRILTMFLVLLLSSAPLKAEADSTDFWMKLCRHPDCPRTPRALDTSPAF